MRSEKIQVAEKNAVERSVRTKKYFSKGNVINKKLGETAAKYDPKRIFMSTRTVT